MTTAPQSTSARISSVAALLFLQFLLAAVRLNQQDIDKDERTTSRVVRYEFADMVRDRFVAGHPPLYFSVLWGWVRFAGHSYATLAAFSILAGAVSLLIILALAGELGLPGWSWAVGLLWCVHPTILFHIRYLRPYAGVVALACAALYVTLVALRKPDRQSLLMAFLIGLIGAFWNHSLLVLWIGIAAAAVLTPPLRRGLGRGHLAAWCGIIAAHLTMIELCQLARVGEHPLAWIERPGAKDLLEGLLQLLGGAHLNAADLEFGWIPPLLLFGAVGWTLLRPTRGKEEENAHWRFIALATLIPLGLIIAITYMAQPLLQPRYLIIVMPGVILCAGRALTSLPRRPAVALLIVVVPLLAIANMKVFQKRQTGMRRIIHQIQERYDPSKDAVLFVDMDPTEPLRLFADHNLSALALLPETPKEQEAAAIKSATAGRRRIWVVGFKKRDLARRLPELPGWGEPFLSKSEAGLRVLGFNLPGQ